MISVQFSCVRLFETPAAAAHQASLSITFSRSLLKLVSIESVMPSNHLIHCLPLLLPPSVFPSIRVCSSESVLKSRDITLPTKVRLVKAMFFPVVMYGCESWTVKKAERQRIDTFELWCWRRLLRFPWNARSPF